MEPRPGQAGRDNRGPLVSIILCTYNQENYVREAARSIAAQVCDFPVEIVVADDCSQDRTPDLIAEELAGREDVVMLPRQTNLGVSGNYRRAFQACSGHYVAVLEGDDAWLSPTKLRDQVALLEAHPEASFAVSRSRILFEDTGRTLVRPDLPAGSPVSFLTAEDLIASNFTNFSAVMYRAHLVRAIPDAYFRLNAYDWLLNIWMARFGPIGCVGEVQVLYRIHGRGLWSGQDGVAQLRAQLGALRDYDTFLEGRFTTEFRRLALSLRLRIARARLGRIARTAIGRAS